MPKQNLISADFPAQKTQDILRKLEEIKNELPFLVTLNAKDKKELIKLGNYYKPFVDKAKQVLDSSP